MTLEEQIQHQGSAEEILELFDVAFDADLVRYKRIHLLRFFNQFVSDFNEQAEKSDYQQALKKAYCLIQKDVRPQFQAPCQTCNGCDTL